MYWLLLVHRVHIQLQTELNGDSIDRKSMQKCTMYNVHGCKLVAAGGGRINLLYFIRCTVFSFVYYLFIYSFASRA